MKKALDAWLERVVYARDPKFNQASEQIADVVLPAPPTPEVRPRGQTLDDGKLEILGIGVADRAPLVAGAQASTSTSTSRSKQRTPIAYRFLLVVWPVDAGAGSRPIPRRRPSLARAAADRRWVLPDRPLARRRVHPRPVHGHDPGRLARRPAVGLVAEDAGRESRRDRPGAG